MWKPSFNSKTDQCRYLNFDALLGDLKRKKLFQLLLSCNLKSLTKVNERQRATEETTVEVGTFTRQKRRFTQVRPSFTAS